MNIITVHGSTKKKRLLAESTTYFMVEELLPRHRTLQIEILFSNLMQESGVCGFCNAFTSREFLIEIDKKIDTYSMIETICHEMIHVKQHARRELKNYDHKQMSVLWKNERHSIEPKNYAEFPWEKEAYEYEFKYAKKFLEISGVL